MKAVSWLNKILTSNPVTRKYQRRPTRFIKKSLDCPGGYGDIFDLVENHEPSAIFYTGSFVGYYGELKFDMSKLHGAPSKLLDVSKLSDVGWQSCNTLKSGIVSIYQWFFENLSSLREQWGIL